MELYENIKDTAVRELKEETRITDDNLERVDVFSGKNIILNILMEIKCVQL